MHNQHHHPDIRGQTSLEHLRENLILARARAGISQQELAKKAAIARTTLSRLESQSVNDVSLRTLEQIAVALNTTLFELLSPPQADLADEHAEIARRAADATDRDVPARQFLAALEEADGPRRYSRAGRRRRVER